MSDLSEYSSSLTGRTNSLLVGSPQGEAIDLGRLDRKERIDGWIKITGTLLRDKPSGQKKAGNTCMIHERMNG